MKKRKITAKWTCKNGSKIRICDMTDSHLRNTINMLLRLAEKARYETPFPSFNGEMAQYYAEGEWDALQEASADDIAARMCPEFDLLCDEALQRGIIEVIEP